MTSGSKTFGRSQYHLTTIQVGETREYKAPKNIRDRIRRAAHNHNVRDSGYFTTRCIDGTLYVTRIR
jgi:hypothetical protein